jgi:hypothetical protein
MTKRKVVLEFLFKDQTTGEIVLVIDGRDVNQV